MESITIKNTKTKQSGNLFTFPAGMSKEFQNQVEVCTGLGPRVWRLGQLDSVAEEIFSNGYCGNFAKVLFLTGILVASLSLNRKGKSMNFSIDSIMCCDFVKEIESDKKDT